MKIYFKYILIFVFLTSGLLYAQPNLVPNPSYEIFSNCPTGGQINYAVPWYSPTQGTPDNFNVCVGSGVGTFGVPLNHKSFQYPRTGNAYVGINAYVVTAFGAIESKEYLQVQLTDSLVAQRKYCVSFYVNLTIPPPGAIIANFVAITKLGMYISNDTISQNNQFTLPHIPQILSPPNVYLNDTLNWVEISGLYIAHGGEKYITIGNFNFNSDTAGVVNHVSTASVAYYDIDDVSIMDCTDVGINELENENDISISPNPSTGIFTVSSEKQKIKEIKVINILGEEITITTAPTINLRNQPNGVYFVFVQTEKGVTTRKLIKQ